MTNTVYGNAWEDLSGLGEQYVENNQGWRKRGGWNNDRELVQIFTLRTLFTVTIAISMMGTRFG
jgi:hypothetical protein